MLEYDTVNNALKEQLSHGNVLTERQQVRQTGYKTLHVQYDQFVT